MLSLSAILVPHNVGLSLYTLFQEIHFCILTWHMCLRGEVGTMLISSPSDYQPSWPVVPFPKPKGFPKPLSQQP